MELIQRNIDTISKLCQVYNVDRLYVFGSILTGKFRPDSDIDLLVKLGPVDLYHYLDNYLNLKESLENLLERPVDLIEEQTVKNPILQKSINASKKLIYGRTDRKVAA